MRVSSIYMTSDRLICIVTWQEIHIVGMKVFKKNYFRYIPIAEVFLFYTMRCYRWIWNVKEKGIFTLLHL